MGVSVYRSLSVLCVFVCVFECDIKCIWPRLYVSVNLMLYCIKHTSRSHQGPSGTKNHGLTCADWHYHKIAHQKWCDHPFSSANQTWQQKEQWKWGLDDREVILVDNKSNGGEKHLKKGGLGDRQYSGVFLK